MKQNTKLSFTLLCDFGHNLLRLAKYSSFIVTLRFIFFVNYRNKYENNASYFFSETTVLIILNITHTVVTHCTNPVSVHNVSFKNNTLFPASIYFSLPVLQTLCWSVGALHTLCLFSSAASAKRRPRSASFSRDIAVGMYRIIECE
jgi:hypothetical protein